MRIGISFYLFSNSTVLALRLYFREQRSTLYTVITAGVAVEVGSGAAGRAAMVEPGLAAGRAARVDQLQQSSKVLVQLQAKQQRSSGSAVPASGRDSRHIGAIIRRLIAGITARSLSSLSKSISLSKLTQLSTNLVVEVYKCQR